jgi:hypothetical protein
MPDVHGRALTAAQEILFAAHDLDASGRSDFTEWDLTVATWKRNPNRFGCRGYESEYPDHKRVMKRILRINRNLAGKNETCRRHSGRGDGQQSVRSPQSVYDAVAPYYRNPVFRKHTRDPEEPRMWLGAASFLQLANSEPRHLEDRLRATQRAIDDALAWVEEHGVHQINRGVSAGGEAISKDDLVRLRAFFSLLQERFAHQLEAIRRPRR